ncbi:MAG: phosphatase PAP2 family protein [Candidatus Nanohaloarchaea archaeon]|nr:phosphatase PAP2 family protein [Candidatus Nanohaloarchaea archaeon]
MAGTGILLWFASVRSPLLTDVAASITALGSVTFILLLIYTLYHVGQRDHAVLAAAAAVVGGTAAQVGKMVVARPRPTVVEPLAHGYLQSGAFPSGHTTLAFAVATVLQQELGGTDYYLFLLAALVGTSRLYLGLHWPGDVVAGAVLGVAAGLLVHRYRDTVLAAAGRHL